MSVHHLKPVHQYVHHSVHHLKSFVFLFVHQIHHIYIDVRAYMHARRRGKYERESLKNRWCMVYGPYWCTEKCNA
jgi:hypothetical protein